MPSPQKLAFEPPGPGSWTLDTMHWTRPGTRFAAEIFPECLARGAQESARRYGALQERPEIVFIHGFPYSRRRHMGAPPDATGHPSKEEWQRLMETDPEIKQRLATAATVFERKLWREDLRDWDERVKPESLQRQREIQAVDPSSLSTQGLLDYLDHCRESLRQGIYTHHRFNLAAMMPVGNFLAHAHQWTGRPPNELLSLLQGATPVSRGADKELERLASVVEDSAEARSLLNSERDPADVLSALRNLDGQVGAAASAYVDAAGYLPLNGLDMGEPYALEVPDVLLNAIRSAVASRSAPSKTDDLRQHIAEVRSAVPQEHRQDFDSLLEEARLVYRLRDERGLYCDYWGHGLMRRAILEAGRRLTEQGRIDDPPHLVEAAYAEVRSLVSGGDGPSAQELAERARFRFETTFDVAPEVLGPPPGPSLPPEWLPEPAARLHRALAMSSGMMGGQSEASQERPTIQGTPVSSGTYEGTARLIRQTEELGRVRSGDVLVTKSTGASFNVVLPLLGALVTDRGGLLSHSAIVAREYGIPAVVGCRDATKRIADGARVRVDGSSGQVTVL